MIRISQLKLNIGHNKSDLRNAVLHKLRISDTELADFVIRKRSIDARKKGSIVYVYTVDVRISSEDSFLRRNKDPRISKAPNEGYNYPEPGTIPLLTRPVIIGSGPSGLFAAYFLAKKGFRPIVLERGPEVHKRAADVEEFWKTNVLDPESNIQFGEGGAGTFSDGKLNTGNNDLYGRNNLVLQTFVENGAPEEILYINKPHLGTDLLINIIYNMRKAIEANGGEYHFNTCFSEFITDPDVYAGSVSGSALEETQACTSVSQKAAGVKTSDGRKFDSDVIILATGHSARDTYDYIIHKTALNVAAKPFAVGVRVEHDQKDIDRAQYGDLPQGLLPPADYKLVYHAASGRSVYSFCMCPGGFVVNSSSQKGAMCINGMSYSARDSVNANSAIVVSVRPSDDPLQNIAFVQELEKKAYESGNGCIVSQLLGDFEKGIISTDFGKIKPCHKGKTVMGNIRDILPDHICNDIIQAMHAFSERIEGFDSKDVIVSAVESRTSSPVRILRNEDMESNISGIYPVGEGAGYAGGIMSAAIDGIKVFEKIYGRYYYEYHSDKNP